MADTRPFAAHEWMIAWRYMRARRAEGGVSVMTWISLIGIALAVFAMLATLAVRSGYRAEFVASIIGTDAHLDLYGPDPSSPFSGYEDIAARVAEVEGVVTVAPVVVREALVTLGDEERLAEVVGMSAEALAQFDRIVDGPEGYGDISRYEEGIIIGASMARALGAYPGAEIDITIRGGAATPLGRSVRVNRFEVVYVFSTGNELFDSTRAYIPLDTAQLIFDRDGQVDRIALQVTDPEAVDAFVDPVVRAAGAAVIPWSWREGNSGRLRALQIEDNVMFILLAVLVLIAVLNIVSGLIMLVKNKGRDIGILRTIGLTRGGVMRVFFLCGAAIGTLATLLGVALGALFVLNFDAIFAFVDWLNGGDLFDPEKYVLTQLPVRFEWSDVLSTMGLSLGLSWFITIFPSRRAARMNPVEALRYE